MPWISRPDTAECDVSGERTDTTVNNVPEDQEDLDTGLPPGWVLVTARRVVKNPELDEYMSTVDKQADVQAKDQVTAWVRQGQVKKEDAKKARKQLREQVKQQIMLQIPPPAPLLVEEARGVLAPSKAFLLQDNYGFEAFDVVGSDQ